MNLNLWLLVDTYHHTCAKFAVFSPTLSQNHIKPEDSDQNFEYILCKNCNSSSTGRHAKLSERKFDFNIFDIDIIIIH